MNFWQLWKMERKKIKGTHLSALLFIAPLLVVTMGISNLSRYFTPEYSNAWSAMFIQSALAYCYYLLPFEMIVVCVLIAGREKSHRGLIKMLSLPVNRSQLSLAKFCLLLEYLLREVVIFFFVFFLAGYFATVKMGVKEVVPLGELFSWCGAIFVTMVPCVAVMWAITVVFRKTILAVSLNFLLVIPGILMANTPLWLVYPYCYSGYFITCFLHAFTRENMVKAFPWTSFLPCGIVLGALFLFLSLWRYGKKEYE